MALNLINKSRIIYVTYTYVKGILGKEDIKTDMKYFNFTKILINCLPLVLLP